MGEEHKTQVIEAAGQSFIVESKCVQNHTWQGVVTWVEQKKKVPFRSALELIKLLDSAVGSEHLETMEEWK